MGKSGQHKELVCNKCGKSMRSDKLKTHKCQLLFINKCEWKQCCSNLQKDLNGLIGA